MRGALIHFDSLTAEERRRGIVAASAGNHALGVAFAAAALGGDVKATLFVPETAPRAKVEKLRRFPVEVRETAATYDDAVAAARAFERETGATFVHAFEDPRTAAGQGTLRPRDPRRVPRRGHGAGAGGRRRPDRRHRRGGQGEGARRPHRGRAAEASPALRESLRLGRPLLDYPAGPTLADGLAGGIGEIAFDHRDLIDEIVDVTEAEIEDAIVALLAADQVVAEASGAVGVAALRAGKVPGARARAGRRPCHGTANTRRRRRLRRQRRRARARPAARGRGLSRP